MAALARWCLEQTAVLAIFRICPNIEALKKPNGRWGAEKDRRELLAKTDSDSSLAESHRHRDKP